MGLRPAVRKEVLTFKRKVGKRIHVDRMIVFGSQATGMARRDSDVDIIVISADFKGKRWMDRPVLLYGDWSDKFPMDLLCYTPKEFEEKSRSPGMIKESIKTAIEV